MKTYFVLFLLVTINIFLAWSNQNNESSVVDKTPNRGAINQNNTISSELLNGDIVLRKGVGLISEIFSKISNCRSTPCLDMLSFLDY